MAAHAPHARTGYWPLIVPRMHCGRSRVAIDPAVMPFGHAAHDRQSFQEMAHGMGDGSGFRVGRWLLAFQMGVIER